MNFKIIYVTLAICFANVLLADTTSLTKEATNLKIVSYNTHGGHGNLQVNLAKFKQMLDGDEHVLFLQEIGPDIWEQVKAAFPEFSYSYKVWQKTTTTGHEPWWTGGGILSKLPILEESEGLIQIDPGGDLWERRAAFVKIQTGPNPSSDYVYLSHYHNTYNWDNNDFQSEREGMTKYRQFILSKLGEASLDNSKPYILAGDWNIFKNHVSTTLFDSPYHYGFWRDHVNTNVPMLVRKWIDTVGVDISDHNAISVSFQFPVTY